MFACMHVCVCACVCVHVYIYIYTYIHTHIHTYIHTYIQGSAFLYRVWGVAILRILSRGVTLDAIVGFTGFV